MRNYLICGRSIWVSHYAQMQEKPAEGVVINFLFPLYHEFGVPGSKRMTRPTGGHPSSPWRLLKRIYVPLRGRGGGKGFSEALAQSTRDAKKEYQPHLQLTFSSLEKPGFLMLGFLELHYKYFAMGRLVFGFFGHGW